MDRIILRNDNGSVYYRQGRGFKIKELDFEGDDEHFIAETTIGRYFIDKTEEDTFESYSDIEEIGLDITLAMAEERIYKHHQRIILNCLEWTDQ